MDKAIEDAKNRELFNNLSLPEFDEVISNNGNITNSSENDDAKMNEAILNSDNETDVILSGTQANMGFIEWILDSSYGAINELNEIVVSKDATRAQEIRNIINRVINENYSKLSPMLSNDNDNLQKLKDAYNNTYIQNPQIMPFTLPFTDNNIIGEAFFALATACLIDLFSFLIAFALINKQKSILYFKKVGDLRANREEMLEDCLMYICLDSIRQDTEKKTMSQSEIQEFVVDKINEVMSGFMKTVHTLYLSDDLNSFGYITEDDVAQFNENEKRLFFTLNNAALIHPCYHYEIIKIINADFDEYTPDSVEAQADKELIKKYETIFEKGKIYYLVSKNLHVWFCENFSELLQNSLLFNAPDPENPPCSGNESPQMNGGEHND